MESTISLAAATAATTAIDRSAFRRAFRKNISRDVNMSETESQIEFRQIRHADMDMIWPYLMREEGRTTDFSYGGLLMWVDCFQYEYAIVNDTLLIKGVLENDLSKPAFSLPVGKMSIADSIGLIRRYCARHGLRPELSAVPEYAVDEIRNLGIVDIEELADWGDYLYDAHTLATLSGKKMGKKRNHVNKFDTLYPNHKLVPLTKSNAEIALNFMTEIDLEGDNDGMAAEEREMTRKMLQYIKEGDKKLTGAILQVGEEVAAFTIGDIKRDTLYVHVEKASRLYEGSYEKINKEFAAMIRNLYPGVNYINREDDSGDMGLRQAKLSYHPERILRKFNILL